MSRLRIVSLLALMLGAAVGLLASKQMWNYYWVIPVVSLGSELEPKAAAMVITGEGWQVLSKEERDRSLESELLRCSKEGEVCTFGRPLRRWGAETLATLPVLDADDALELLASARSVAPVGFLGPAGSGKGGGIVLTLGSDTTLAAFHTGELHDDTYGYVEVLFQGRGATTVRKAAATYLFDLAGLEFLTPPVLVGLGMVLALLASVVGMAVARGFRKGGS
jgi:hypothetical protein